MPSSKSSKRSSKLSTKVSSSKFSINDPKTKKSTSFKFGAFIFSLIINGIILYYLYNLEDINCQCIRDWRHNFIKIMCYISIVLSIIPLFGIDTMKMLPIILFVIAILGFINLYSIYTYVGDLNTTKCICAVDKQPTINWMMGIYRYYIIGLIVFFFIVAVVFPIILYSTSKYT